jgi:Protein of unknown function DUF58
MKRKTLESPEVIQSAWIQTKIEKKKSFLVDPFNHFSSTTLMAMSGIAFLACGVVTFRADLIILGLIPYIILSYSFLCEQRILSGLKTNPLRGLAYPPKDIAKVGQEIFVKIELENKLPVSLGILRIEIKHCKGLSSQGFFIKKLEGNSKLGFNVNLIPLRPGKAFFYGISLVITAPFGFRPRRFYLVLPMSISVMPNNPFASIKKRNLPQTLVEKKPLPTFDGDFAELREFVRGDPVKAIVWSASMRRRKPIIRLSYPTRNIKWGFIVDLSPSSFKGIPGFSFMDNLVSIIPEIKRLLEKAEQQTSLILYREKVLENIQKFRSKDIVSLLTSYRFKYAKKGIPLDSELIFLLSKHMLWNFGIQIGMPDSLIGKGGFDYKKRLISVYNKIPVPRNEKKHSLTPESSLDSIIFEFSKYTGFEIPQFTQYKTALMEALDEAISNNINKVLIFSEMEPAPSLDELLPRFKIARKKGVELNLFVLDSRMTLLRPYGNHILEREAFYRWGKLIPALRSTGGKIRYWSPHLPHTMLDIFKN